MKRNQYLGFGDVALTAFFELKILIFTTFEAEKSVSRLFSRDFVGIQDCFERKTLYTINSVAV